MKYTARGASRVANMARGEAECYICHKILIKNCSYQGRSNRWGRALPLFMGIIKLFSYKLVYKPPYTYKSCPPFLKKLAISETHMSINKDEKQVCFLLPHLNATNSISLSGRYLEFRIFMHVAHA